MDRGSNKHSPMRDDELKHETEGLVRGHHATHAEEWNDPEPSGEDQPDVDVAADTTLLGGIPPGMQAADVAGRTELASFLGREAYPMVREQVINLLIDRHAPAKIVDLTRRLPSGREFHNVNEIWTAVGGQVETERF